METVRVKHLSQINKLESEIRALEVTVNTLGNFISTLAYEKTDIEIPNDVLRILSQLNIAEKRRSSLSKSSLSDLNNDGDSNRDQRITLGQIKSNSLSPKTGSSYFSKSFGQIRQQKLGILSNETNNKLLQNSFDNSIGLTKSLSDTRHIKFDKIVEESTDRTQSLGRVLTSHEMEKLKLFQKNYSKEFQKPEQLLNTIKSPLKISKSNFELSSSLENEVIMKSHSQYPLNCGGVHISYSGATKLKSLRPSRVKSEVQINVPKSSCKEHEIRLESVEDDNDNNFNKNSSDNNDSAFDESIESIDSNGNNVSEKNESTVSSLKDPKLNNLDIAVVYNV